MFVFVLILLLLAAVFGVLAVVVKTALVIALSIVLAVTLLGAVAYYTVRHKMRRFQREIHRRLSP